MDLRRAAAVAATALLLAGACGEADEPAEPQPPEPPPTASEVSSCLEELGIAVRERRRPSYASATVELVVGEKRRAGVRVGMGVLFFPSDAAVEEALNQARIVADPLEVVGRVGIVRAGPGFEAAEQALLTCLG